MKNERQSLAYIKAEGDADTYPAQRQTVRRRPCRSSSSPCLERIQLPELRKVELTVPVPSRYHESLMAVIID